MQENADEKLQEIDRKDGVGGVEYSFLIARGLEQSIYIAYSLLRIPHGEAYYFALQDLRLFYPLSNALFKINNDYLTTSA